MTEGDNKADAQTSEGAGQSGNETVVETVARKVGSTIGTIASKVSGSETSDPKEYWKSRKKRKQHTAAD
jgi:hypothetical protein